MVIEILTQADQSFLTQTLTCEQSASDQKDRCNNTSALLAVASLSRENHSMDTITHFIAGAKVHAHHGVHLGDVFNPATGQLARKVSMGGAAEVDAAVSAASEASRRFRLHQGPLRSESPRVVRVRRHQPLAELDPQNLHATRDYTSAAVVEVSGSAYGHRAGRNWG
jgi:hypothetical protein